MSTEVGPRERSAGLAYVHDIELDGEELEAGQRVEILDGAGDFHAAVVVERVGPRWKLRIQPCSEARRLSADVDHPYLEDDRPMVPPCHSSGLRDVTRWSAR